MNGILGSAVLDVAIGIVFVYLLLGIICTTVNEWISGILNTRSKMLEQAIKQLLDNQPAVPAPSPPAATSAGAAPAAATPPQAGDFVDQFYRHPIISSMKRGLGSHAAHFSYLPARSFAAVVTDLVTPHAQGRIDLATLEQGIKSMPDGDVKRGLLAAIQNAGDSLEEAQKSIEAWFDDTMDRVSGWYKRSSQKWIIALALLVTVAVNADTVHMARILWMNPTLRAQVVEQAKDRTTASPPVSSAEQKVLESLVGWEDLPDPPAWYLRVLGWLLTAVAVSLGAPFWFDMLNKFMNLRNAGKSPDEAAKTPAKPQQPPDNTRP